jgi:Ala-tRNA(Pro) deacylase
MLATLGVEPGAVTPFGIVNDSNGQVTVVLEERVLGCDLLNFHPLRNDATATIAREDFLRFLEAQNHRPIIVTL